MIVATAPTVYGIETIVSTTVTKFNIFKVATAPTVYGIETLRELLLLLLDMLVQVATAPTVYGIETIFHHKLNSRLSTGCNSTYRLRY